MVFEKHFNVTRQIRAKLPGRVWGVTFRGIRARFQQLGCGLGFQRLNFRNFFQPRGLFEVFLLKSVAHRGSGAESVSLLNTFVCLEIEILWIP